VIQERFDSNEVVYVSLGSLTLIKPAIKKIREQGFPTKILQWPRDRDPHGKVTYPDDLKVRMYQILHDAFSAWHDDVFFYLCMEKSAIWDRVFGFHYSTNDEFEIAMLEHLPVGETFET
jgi:spore photoproduct lyase